jgi:hypothetical protein
MSMDVTGVVVALAGIVGTLGAAALTQLAATRNKQLDATIQRDIRTEERRESARAEAHGEKRATYAELNAAAREFRTAGHDYLVDKLRGAEQNDLEQLEITRAKYRDVFARAQMVLPDRALAVASEVNDCLGYSYRTIRDIDNGSERSINVEKLHQWYDENMVDAVGLLRRVLREDLGVAEPSTDTDPSLRSLQKARLELWLPDRESSLH